METKQCTVTCRFWENCILISKSESSSTFIQRMLKSLLCLVLAQVHSQSIDHLGPTGLSFFPESVLLVCLWGVTVGIALETHT